jgi:hypothetical protein
MALANCTAFAVFALEIVPNQEFRRLRGGPGLPTHQLVGDGRSLPAGPESIEVALVLGTLEHIPEPARLGAEVMRALRRSKPYLPSKRSFHSPLTSS